MLDDGDLILVVGGFYTEHRRCGLLDGGVDDHGPRRYTVWMVCSCGARLARHCTEGEGAARRWALKSITRWAGRLYNRPVTPFDVYGKKLSQALKAGNATEHTHRPALKALIEALAPGVVATNEPQKIDCGSPDFIVTRKGTPLGYIEAKDVGADLARVENNEQLKRYRGSLRNLVLTDYLAFRLYRNGELVQTARLGKWQPKSGVLQAASSSGLPPHGGGLKDPQETVATRIVRTVGEANG